MADAAYRRLSLGAALAISSVIYIPCAAAEPPTLDLQTAVVQQGVLYVAAIDRTSRLGARLAAVPLAGEERATTYFLPARAVSPYQPYPFVWELSGKSVYFTSVLETAPAQHSFALAAVPLAKLQRLGGPGDAGLPNANVVMPGLNDKVADMWPISNAYIKVGIRGSGSVHYDVRIRDAQTFEIFILWNRHLEIWSGSGRAWESGGTYEWDCDGPFTVVGDAAENILISGAGAVYRLDNAGPVKIGDWRTDDADARDPLVLQSDGDVSLIHVADILDPTPGALQAFVVDAEGLSAREIPEPLRVAAQKGLRLLQDAR